MPLVGVALLVVVEMRTSSQTGEATRIVGLSTAMANAADLADWLGIGQEGLFNFRRREMTCHAFPRLPCHARPDSRDRWHVTYRPDPLTPLMARRPQAVGSANPARGAHVGPPRRALLPADGGDE